MGRGGRGGGSNAHHAIRRPVDLTGFISVAEKNDLVTLISAITDKMHNDISTVFDFPSVAPAYGQDELLRSVQSVSLHQRPDNQWPDFDKENNKPAAPAQPRPSATVDGPNTYTPTRGAAGQEGPGPMTTQLQELKKEAVMFFRKWQNAITQRAREITVIESTPSPQASTPRGRGGRGPQGGSLRGRGGRSGASTGRGGLILAAGKAPRYPLSCRRHAPAWPRG